MQRFKHLRVLAFMLSSVGVISGTQATEAGDFPTHPVRLIVPYAAGGGTDVLARQVSKYAAKRLGQPIVVENKAGASTVIGAELVARAKPDGYTLLWGDNTTFAVNMHRKNKPDYDSIKSFAPITLTRRGELALVASSDKPYKTLQEFMQYAKTATEPVSYGTPGLGSPHHLSMAKLGVDAGIKLQAIHYKGEAPAIRDLIGGQLDVMFSGFNNATPHIQSGRVNMLAISSAKRHPDLPDVPAISEVVPGYVGGFWQAVVAPQGTPENVIKALNEAFVGALNDPEYLEWADKMLRQSEPVYSTPQELGEFIKSEVADAEKVITTANIVLE